MNAERHAAKFKQQPSLTKKLHFDVKTDKLTTAQRPECRLVLSTDQFPLSFPRLRCTNATVKISYKRESALQIYDKRVLVYRLHSRD